MFTIFVCGDNGKGQLGLGDQIKREEKPVLHQELKKLKVVDFDCGATHCIALTTNGEVLTWGLGTHDNGALGTMFINAEGTMSRKQEVNLTKEDKMVPRVVDLKHLDPGNITQVAATNDASFALTEDGRVFGWGTFKASSIVTLSWKFRALKRTLTCRNPQSVPVIGLTMCRDWTKLCNPTLLASDAITRSSTALSIWPDGVESSK